MAASVTAKSLIDQVRTSNEKQAELIQQRINYRKEKWDDEKRAWYDDFQDRLRKAHTNMVQNIEKHVISTVSNILNEHPNKRTFVLFDPEKDDAAELYQFKNSTVYKGFWNAENKRHDRLPHIESGINETPFREVQRLLYKRGFLLTDVSDFRKSYKTVIRVDLIDEN